MQLIVQKSPQLNGKIVPPSSKSETIRALFFALLAKGQSELANPLNSDDSDDAIKACRDLGADIIQQENKIILNSQGLPLPTKADRLHTGNSGITTRFMMPILGLRQNNERPILFDCGEQMRARPIHSLVQALQGLGMTIEYLEQKGSLPVRIAGHLVGGKVEVNGLTSQYLSALLISLPCAEEDSEIIVQDLHERPYAEMTLTWLKKQAIQFTHEQETHYDLFSIKGGQRYVPFNTWVPGDFSSASYLIAAAVLLGKKIEIAGLDMESTQGDKRLIRILQQMGADIIFLNGSLHISNHKALTGIAIDANDVPDLLPTLAVLGCFAKGKTEIRNVRQGRIKETDRIHSMTEGLRRLGARIDEHEDGLTVYQSTLQGAPVRGYNDHRTVMALAIAGLMAEGQTCIDDATAVNKTFPLFPQMMQSLGARLEVQHDRS